MKTDVVALNEDELTYFKLIWELLNEPRILEIACCGD